MEIKFILTLLETKNISRATVKKILDLKYNSINYLEDLHKLVTIAKSVYSRVYIPTHSELYEGWEKSNRILSDASKLNIKVISYLDEDYPTKFKDMKDAPMILYYRGNLNILNGLSTIAIIGTRNPSVYGLEYAIRIAKRVGAKGNTILSGLALGCDTQAHIGALESNTKTIAVLPSCVNEIYPRNNKLLAKKIVDSGGCIISEYPPGSKIHNSNFVQRDRLQSALSDAIIVVETSISGGTMHTVNYSLELNKKIACVDTSNYNEQNGNGNKTLIESKKAMPLKSLRDIDTFLEIATKNKSLHSKNINSKQNTPYQSNLFDDYDL